MCVCVCVCVCVCTKLLNRSLTTYLTCKTSELSLGSSVSLPVAHQESAGNHWPDLLTPRITGRPDSLVAKKTLAEIGEGRWSGCGKG